MYYKYTSKYISVYIHICHIYIYIKRFVSQRVAEIFLQDRKIPDLLQLFKVPKILL